MMGTLGDVTRKDFFISYTGADQGWAEWIADQLEDAGYTTILQAWDFRPGQNFIKRMNEALAATDRVLSVLSPAYFQSKYSTDEWTAALIGNFAHQDRLLPVIVEECAPPPLLADLININLVGVDEATAATRLRTGVIRERIKPSGRRPFPGNHVVVTDARRFPAQQPAIFDVPPRNLNFNARSGLLEILRETLKSRTAGAIVQAVSLTGLGGVGKTQLVSRVGDRL